MQHFTMNKAETARKKTCNMPTHNEKKHFGWRNSMIHVQSNSRFNLPKHFPTHTDEDQDFLSSFKTATRYGPEDTPAY